MVLYRDFPRLERYGIGKRIDKLFLEILELSFASVYLPPQQKIILLTKTISRLDILKFFTQIAWENKFIHTERYSTLSQKLAEIGRMLGGWKRGLENKTPARK